MDLIIDFDDLLPDMAGIRPKFATDFIIKEEEKMGFSGFINLIGIESPGLTASLSIAKAKYIEEMT